MTKPFNMRLDKFISECSGYSRKDVKRLVRSGSVTVNGAKAGSADAKVSDSDEVAVNGEKLIYRKFIYLMLNKPPGYLSATEDAHDPVVTDLVPEEFKHFAPFPIGRLDKDTEGLLILSNDGQFDHAMTSPKKDVRKRYFAILDKPAEESDVAAFASGMEFKEFTAKPALLETTDDPCRVYVEISEGKFHQVKRMCERVGKTVTYLKRVAIGGLELDAALAMGSMRELTPAELESLLRPARS